MTDTSLPGTAEASASADPRDLRIRDMLLAVTRLLVDEEEKLEVLHLAGVEGAGFQIRCATQDLGKLIGKGGRTARAIRTILSAGAAKNGRRYTLDIAQSN